MNSKLYLTIAGIIAILYGMGFVLIPEKMGDLYGVPYDPHSVLNIQFFGASLLGLGVIFWLARDFQEWAAVRGVLIGAVVADVVGGLVNTWGVTKGLFNSPGGHRQSCTSCC
jgi:hypothetical protein